MEKEWENKGEGEEEGEGLGSGKREVEEGEKEVRRGEEWDVEGRSEGRGELEIMNYRSNNC